MHLPEFNGTSPTADFFIYTACDSVYFDNFATALLNSIQHNSGNAVHLHIFNPRPDQLDLCFARKNLTVTWETAPLSLFSNASLLWKDTPTEEPMASQHRRTLSAMTKGHDTTIVERMQKIYFACARFIRLQSIFTTSSAVFSIDVDAVVRKTIDVDTTDRNILIHRVTGKNPRFLAGGIYFNNSAQSLQILSDYSTRLIASLTADYLYWGLDQDLLNLAIPADQYVQLPKHYIDWDMSDSSAVWTAKGTRKDSAKFIAERNRYKF
jgi:hypothetical protein